MHEFLKGCVEVEVEVVMLALKGMVSDYPRRLVIKPSLTVVHTHSRDSGNKITDRQFVS